MRDAFQVVYNYVHMLEVSGSCPDSKDQCASLRLGLVTDFTSFASEHRCL